MITFISKEEEGLWSLNRRAPCLLRLSKLSYTLCEHVILVRATNTEVVKSIGRESDGDKPKSKPWERNPERERGLWSHASSGSDRSSSTYLTSYLWWWRPGACLLSPTLPLQLHKPWPGMPQTRKGFGNNKVANELQGLLLIKLCKGRLFSRSPPEIGGD